MHRNPLVFHLLLEQSQLKLCVYNEIVMTRVRNPMAPLLIMAVLGKALQLLLSLKRRAIRRGKELNTRKRMHGMCLHALQTYDRLAFT